MEVQQSQPQAHDVVSHRADSADMDAKEPAEMGAASEQPMSTSLGQQTQIHTNRQNRHSKRLSLNFPIAVPSTRRHMDSPAGQYSASPAMTPASSGSTPQLSAQADSHAGSTSASLATPLTPPSEISEDGYPRPKSPPRRHVNPRSHTRSHTLAYASLDPLGTLQLPATTTPDEEHAHLNFLTLLAGQERRVLELKEELHRAEVELNTLKTQWALHEATRKKGELKNGGVVKMETVKSSDRDTDPRAVSQRVHLKGHARSATLAAGAGVGLGLEIEEEDETPSATEIQRERQRSLMQERLRKRGTTLEMGSAPSMMGRRTGQRVFSGSRHTRTLSLLPTTPTLGVDDAAKGSEVGGESTSASGGTVVRSSTDSLASGLPSLTRSHSGFGKDLNFGKTYKDLASAASRRTIPQGADVLMRHGKVVVDGMRDGLWSFFEDIRQATVGEEAAREVPTGDKSRHGPHKKASGGSLRMTAKNTAGTSKFDSQQSPEQSFWREFGVDTPKVNRRKDLSNSESTPNSESPKQKPTTPSCPKHGHGHGHGHGHDHAVTKSTGTTRIRNASTTSIKSDNRPPNEIQPKKDHHTSHPSTDSGRSRDSHTTPSLTMDSPFGGSRTTDTDIDLDDETTWDWKESDSPTQVRNQILLPDQTEDEPISDRPSKDMNMDMDILDPAASKRTRRNSTQSGYEWHERSFNYVA